MLVFLSTDKSKEKTLLLDEGHGISVPKHSASLDDG